MANKNNELEYFEFTTSLGKKMLNKECNEFCQCDEKIFPWDICEPIIILNMYILEVWYKFKMHTRVRLK